MYKLMIVDDEPLERRGLRKIIQGSFFNIDIVEDARNGREAIEKARFYMPNIILMDIKMPETTGLEAQRNIARVFPNIKTIILTAYSNFSYAQESIKYGVVDYLLKPVRRDDLKSSIMNAIESLTKDRSVSSHHKPVDTCGENILKNVLNYIQNNYLTQLDLNIVAEYAHLNPQYFSRFFKKEMGINFTEYVAKLRIAKAKRLLTETNYPIYRIAAEVGFSDSAYFNKVFIKYENQPPNKYKQMIKKNDLSSPAVNRSEA